jgi:nucleotide-binding universal stress UspA family protein
MDKIKKILALTDLSEFSQEGVRYALTLAKTLGAEVTVYHVATYQFAPVGGISGARTIEIASPQYERLRKKAQLALARFLNEHFSDLIPWVKIRERVEIGGPEKNIIEWAKREASDLLVFSIHASSDLSEGFIGSLAEKLVANAPCPVLCIHAESGEVSHRAAAVA